MFVLISLHFLLFCLNAEIVTARDVFIKADAFTGITDSNSDNKTKDKVLIPAGTESYIKDTRVSTWYHLSDKGTEGFLETDCIGTKGTSLVLLKDCPLYPEASTSLNPTSIVKSGYVFKKFKLHNEVEHNVVINGKSIWLSSSVLKFVHQNLDDRDLYEPISIQEIISLKKENPIISPYIDKPCMCLLCWECLCL